jgi:molybdopterin/thiamine biosynthesis adenylyltransferase
MAAPTATNAPSALGGLAAALPALELIKLLERRDEELLVGRELYIEQRYHNHYLTRLDYNPACNFDHRSWDCEPVGPLTIREAFAQTAGHDSEHVKLSIEGHSFATMLACTGCQERHPLLCPVRRLQPHQLWCAECDRERQVVGFELVDEITVDQVPSNLLDSPLTELGFLPNDIVTVTSADGDERHLIYAGFAPPEKTTGDSIRSVMIVGCGNIGSHLVAHVARIPQVNRIILVDHDHYTAENLTSQDIGRREIGKPKAMVQAERLSAIDPTLDVVAIADRFDSVPLGLCANTVLMGCVDSRLARLQINQAAWRVGSPWIDAAVNAPNLLVRVSVYVPGTDAPCIECGWDDDDYEQLELVDPACSDASGSGTVHP